MPYGYSGGYPGSKYNQLYQQYPKPVTQDDNPVDQIGAQLDTTNVRPSYQAAAGTGLKSITQVPQTPPAATTVGSNSPELAGLTHSSLAPTSGLTTTLQNIKNNQTGTIGAAGAPGSVPSYLQPIAAAIPGLMNPVTTPLTMDPAARQALVNQVTRGNQQASNIAAEQLREKMATSTGGMVSPGESGIADTALAGIYRGGAANTAQTLGNLAYQEAERYPELAQNLAQLNLARILAGGQLGQGLSEADIAGKQFGLDTQRFGLQQEQFGYGKEMDALNALMSLYGAEQGYQQNAWSPYYSGIVGAYGG